MREFEIKPQLYKKLVKLSKKDIFSYEAIMKKINEVLNSSDVEHYKNLRYDMKDSKRVHIGHFVFILTFE
jgi:mRNA-degrading endonuclease RelE of RelBE toxin-antitoxin system